MPFMGGWGRGRGMEGQRVTKRKGQRDKDRKPEGKGGRRELGGEEGAERERERG